MDSEILKRLPGWHRTLLELAQQAQDKMRESTRGVKPREAATADKRGNQR